MSRKSNSLQRAAAYARQRMIKAREAEERQRLYDVRVPGIPHSRDVVVDDPMERGGKLIATQSIRDDPLGRLQKRGQIDTAQYEAGRHMQMLYERAQIGVVKAMDTTKEPVDGGGMVPEVLKDAQLRAVKEIDRLERALGMEGAALVRQVLGARVFIEQVAAQRGIESRTGREYLGRRFRECLETLARALCYA